MSDGLDIRDGGVVAVDPDSLHATAARCESLADRVRDAAALVSSQAPRLHGLVASALSVPPPIDEVMRVAQQVAAAADQLAGIAVALRAAARAYEVVEQRARLAMAATAHEAAARGRRLAALEAAHPGAARDADALLADRHRAVADGIVSPANAGWLIPAALAAPAAPGGTALLAASAIVHLSNAAQALEALMRQLGAGRIAPGDRLGGDRPPVTLARLRVAAAAAPEGLADALGRIPDADARVRVEAYAMPDGTHRYAVYIAGTRTGSVHPDGPDPWDMLSNLQLYTGADSASFEAVRAALADAGVPPDAPVYLFGHSQGAMIAGRLAIEGGYDTRLLVTAGSPTQAAVGPGTLSAELRHTDDVVQALAAGGSAVRVGAPGSMVVDRVGDPLPRLDDLKLAAHHLAGYVATAAMVDAAADPRAAALREKLSELRAATSVTVVDYDARRPAPAPRPAPRPVPSPGPAPGDGAAATPDRAGRASAATASR